MSDAKDLIEKISVENIKTIMSDNGGNLYKENNAELWYNTICHGGDSHKLCYYVKSKKFHCYTNCGQMSLFDLIQKIRNCNFIESIHYLEDLLGIESDKVIIGFGDPDKDKIIDKDTQKKEAIYDYMMENQNGYNKTSFSVVDRNILGVFSDKYYKDWIEQGISIDSMRKFEIKWNESKKHIIIPHKNIEGELIGIRRRSLNEEELGNKYMPETIGTTTYAHSLGANLYGLYENKEAINRLKKVVIVEGEKSVLLSDTFFGKESCAVATCGFNLSKKQIDLLLDNCDIEDIYLAFDKDFDVIDFQEKYSEDSKEYKQTGNYINKLRSFARKLKNNARVKIILDRDNLLDLKDSPFDKGKEIYKQLEKDAVLNNIGLKDISSNWRITRKRECKECENIDFQTEV